MFPITEEIITILSIKNIIRGNAITIKRYSNNEPFLNAFFVDGTPDEILQILLEEMKDLKVISNGKTKRIKNGIPELEIEIDIGTITQKKIKSTRITITINMGEFNEE